MHDGISQALGFGQENRASQDKGWRSDNRQNQSIGKMGKTLLRIIFANICSHWLGNRRTTLKADKLDEEPDMEELSKNLDTMSSDKAPGKDAIPAEFWNVVRTFSFQTYTPSSSVVGEKKIFHKT